MTSHPADNLHPKFETSILGVVPAGWQVDRIRDLLVSVVGGEWGDDPDAHEEGELVRVARVADIRGLHLAQPIPTVRRVRDSKLVGRILGPRSVLIEKSGGGAQTPVGRAVACHGVEGRAICSNFMAKLECGPKLDACFLVHLLAALYTCGVNEACIQQTTGIQNLRVADYLNTKVAVPPLAEQVLIATFLASLRRRLDAIGGSNGAEDGHESLLARQSRAVEDYWKSMNFEVVSGRRRVMSEQARTGTPGGS
jgi:type I restriction enzyme S subunit